MSAGTNTLLMQVALPLLIAYFIGGIMGGDLMRLLLGGADLREQGSGNVGATNALRSRGKGFAIGVLLIDIAKGLVAVLALPLAFHPERIDLSVLELRCLCGYAATLGHCYPVLLKFRGGKGVATAAGVFGALMPGALPWMIVVFVLAVMLTGWVAVASIGGAVAALLYAVFMEGGIRSPMGFFAAGMTLLVVYKHRSNLAKLAAGQEHRFEKARVLGRRLDQWRGR